MDVPSWYKQKSVSAVQEPEKPGVTPVEDGSAAPDWFKAKSEIKAPAWYKPEPHKNSYEGAALDVLSAGTKYLISKAASSKSIPQGIFDDAALGIGKVQGWCGEYASRLSTASKVGDSWAEKMAHANKTPDAKNNIDAGYKVVLPLGVKNGQGYGHVITAITKPDANGNFYAAQSNADGRQNKGEGLGVATYGIFNVNDLNKRYGSNWGALPGQLKTNVYANGKSAIPIQKPQNDTGSETNWALDLLGKGANIASKVLPMPNIKMEAPVKLSNDQAPPMMLNVNNPKVLADYVLKKGISDLQNKEWWVNSPVKNEAWKILNDTRGVDTSKFNPGIVKAEIGTFDPNKSVHTLTQAEADKMGKPDILTGSLYQGAGNEKGFQPAIQEKRMNTLYYEADQKAAADTRQAIQNFSADLTKKFEKNQNPISAYIGKHAIETASGFLDGLIGTVSKGAEGLQNWKEQGRLSGQSIAQIGGAGLAAVFMPYVTEFNASKVADPVWHEIGDPLMKFVGEQAPAVGEWLGNSYEKVTGQKGSAKEIAPVASEIFSNVAPLLVMHAYDAAIGVDVVSKPQRANYAPGEIGDLQYKKAMDKFSVSMDFQKNVADSLNSFRADPVGFLKKITTEFQQKNKGESATLRDEVAKPFDPHEPDALVQGENGKTKLDMVAEQRAKLSELQSQGKKTAFEVIAGNSKALEVSTFTYSDGKVGAGITLKTDEHSVMTPIVGEFNSPREAVQAVLPKIEELTSKGSDIATEAIRQKIDQLKETNFKEIPAKEVPKPLQEGAVKPNELAQFKPETAMEKNFKKPKIVEGTGEEKTRSLAVGVEQKAIEHRLTNEFGDLPTYKEVNMGDQARQAQDLHAKDPELALKVALGEAPAPKGLLPESVFVAVENEAIKRGDVETLKALATQSKLVSEATLMGQRIRALGERDPESPVAAITSLVRARENVILKKLKKGETVEGVKKKGMSELKMEIKKVSSKQSWSDFIESIKC